MRKRTARAPRESALASGWTVEGDPAPAPQRGAPADPDRSASDAPRAESGASGGADAGDGAGPAGAPARDDADAPAELSNAALVLLGVLGGLYLLYAWIWLSWAQFYAEQNASVAASSGALGSVLQQIVFWAAPLAPILWFVSVLVLCRGAGTRRLAAWLVLGAVVLLPLPVFGGGGA